jgi:hypothetical protein
MIVILKRSSGGSPSSAQYGSSCSSAIEAFALLVDFIGILIEDEVEVEYHMLEDEIKVGPLNFGSKPHTSSTVPTRPPNGCSKST